MSQVTITVTTDRGNVEVTETSPHLRSLVETDVDHVDNLLTRAAAKVRAAYDIAEASRG